MIVGLVVLLIAVAVFVAIRKGRALHQEHVAQAARRGEEVRRHLLFRQRAKEARQAEITKQQSRVNAYRRQCNKPISRVVHTAVPEDESSVTGVYFVGALVPYYGTLDDLTPKQRRRFVHKFNHASGATYADVFGG